MLNANELHEIATLPFGGFSTQRQFLAQVTEPQVLVNASKHHRPRPKAAENWNDLGISQP